MPAAVTSPSPARLANDVSTPRPRGQVKKKRIIRRRGRAPGDIGSDDEIEREVATDSESEDELSSLDSSSDSDTEPASEDVVPNGRSRTFTPSTSQSPGDRGVEEKEADATPFFSAGGNWSEMVADEHARGPAELPVIEFADFSAQDTVPATSRPKKAKKFAKHTRSASAGPAPTSQLNGDQSAVETRQTQRVPSTSRSPGPSFSRRPAGLTARQAYQQKLESDPSYVPTVGGFWGHDDRLLDKDLRSLSGWWRGRWQGRGRGRGFIRGRGRGGFFGGYANDHDGVDLKDVPPIEQQWTHDGYEELKQREEQRRAAQRTQPPAPQGPASFRGGRGGSVRGGRGGFGRGGYINSSGRSSANSGRIWFPMKPELMWTKQHEGFLYFETDPSLKPRQGQGQGFLVKLPGIQAKVVRAPARTYPAVWTSASKRTTAGVAGVDEEERVYAVNLPQRSGREKEVDAPVASVPVEETSAVKPSAKQVKESPPIAEAVAVSPPAAPHVHRDPPSHHVEPPIATSSTSEPEASIRLQLEQLSVEPDKSDGARLAKTEEAVLKNPPTEPPAEEEPAPSAPSETAERLSVPIMSTHFSPPVSHPSPVYGSPYAYSPALPPGIAMNQHGIPYELATGRPVYLQAPPPPPVYNPRPIMHSHLSPSGLAFVPGHMSHHSTVSAISPDFLAHSSHTPPMNGFVDPSTGTPIFSFPRQSSRIEIRAPTEGTEVKSPSKTSASRHSELRTASTAFAPVRPSSDTSANGYFPTISTSPENGTLPSYAPMEGADGSPLEGHQHDPAMMGYAQYPHHYYYPDAYGGYTHNPYVDMSHARPYEMYPPPEGAVYY
ncbi:putative CASC3/Barentsz eIF4AIII binding protein [Lyophyllum shimeji]|uniref:CASC3/Barentsz eIF4AIII binding protein n=1 Tax=Lyophyllum shimeji TaxID=47721 RepID=A0A9P3PEN7_LYOSH|nr:putative CASC3/Barentsz eIF4AIII binding protein [Lyophyllum shimeji]